MVPTRTFVASRAPANWQVSLRSLLVLTAMVAMVLAWWREFGHRYYPWWPNDFSGWLVLGTVAAPFILPVAGSVLYASGHVGNLLRAHALLAGANVVVDYCRVLHYSNPHRTPRMEDVYEGLNVALFGEFVLPVSLALVAVASIPRSEFRPHARDYGIMILVTGQVLLLYWLVPLVLETAYATWWNR